MIDLAAIQKSMKRHGECVVICFRMTSLMISVTPDIVDRISSRHHISHLRQGTSETHGIELSQRRRRVFPMAVPAAAPAFAAALAAAFVTNSTPLIAASGCDTLWAQNYAQAHSFANCDVLTVACDSDEDEVRDNFCTVNELLDEFREDPLHGELVDALIIDGIVDAYPDEVVPNKGDELEFDLSFHGGLIVEAVLEDLRTGKTVPVHEDSTEVTLPWLESADQVMIAGQSGGSVGLTSRVDRMAEHMAAWGSTAEVLALFDARGKPGIDHESARSMTSRFSRPTLRMQEA